MCMYKAYTCSQQWALSLQLQIYGEQHAMSLHCESEGYGLLSLPHMQPAHGKLFMEVLGGTLIALLKCAAS